MCGGGAIDICTELITDNRTMNKKVIYGIKEI